MRWPFAVVAAVAAAAFLAGIGVSLVPAAPPGPSAAPTSASPRFAPSDGVLRTLARPQRSADRPRIAVGARLERATFRLIDHGTLADLYVARDTGRRICLVAVTVDDHFAAACGRDAKGLSAPLRLRFTATTPGGGDSTQQQAGLPATR